MDADRRKTELDRMRSRFEKLREKIHSESEQSGGKLRPVEIIQLSDLARSSSTRLISEIVRILNELQL